MPLFSFRLEAQDGSGHFRQGTIEAADAAEAEATLAVREYRFQLFTLSPEQIQALEAAHGSALVLAAIGAPKEAKMPPELPAQARSRLALHRQSKPYKLVKLEKKKAG